MVHSFSYRVYYEDTDAGGVVYYANYLRFAERARTDFLRERGVIQSELLEKRNIAFVVHSLTAQFHAPARLDDMLDVSVEISETKSASITMQQEISLKGKKLFSLNITIVCVTAAMKPIRLPNDISVALVQVNH
jgi:acyl-CoA thioester hydrolase